MPLFQLHQVSLSYSNLPLLNHVDLQIKSGERIALLGRNGSGKTSLMRLMTREETPRSGEIICPQSTITSYLSQEIPEHINGSVIEVIRSGLKPNVYEEEWESDRRLEALAEKMHLSIDASFTSLSGGLKRRTLLAHALASKPDLLLLDEPTNHLDLETIFWLEEFLLTTPITLFFVTHDRAFLKKLATRILELDRGNLTSWDCDYLTYLSRKAAWLDAEEKQWSCFDKKLAQEEVWLRQGVKARRTRNEGRVRALEKLRQERMQRRERQGKARINLQEGDSSGQKVIEAKEISFAYDQEPIINKFTTTIWRGDKIGIIGTNGSGKTTLLKLLLGQIAPHHGSIHLGTKLQILYFDQLRGTIDQEKSVVANVTGDAETIIFQGRPRHIHSYLEDFLFSRERIRMPAKVLSGGERNRLLLAKLFLQPTNVLVMDEPTNDLDAETMELLEELVIDYKGTLLLVSHDRAFLNNVVTSTLVFEGAGRIMEYSGGYDDWMIQRRTAKKEIPPIILPPHKKSPAPLSRPISFLKAQERELKALLSRIEQYEAEKQSLLNKLCDPLFYKKEPEKLSEIEELLATLEDRITCSYARWEELEAERQKSL